jgi:cytidylate kinase
MAIICISRQLAALGDETAQELAKLLNYRFVDRGMIEERLKSYGLGDKTFEKYDERKPSFLDSISEERDDYLHYLKKSLFEVALESLEKHSGCVFIGRGANSVFQSVSAAFSVYLVAPIDIRIARVKNYFRCEEKKARSILDKSDKDRIGFYKYFFEVDWRDPANYRISLNTGHLSPGCCARIISDVGKDTIDGEDEKVLPERLRDLLTGQEIVHHIIYERGLPIHFLDAEVVAGEARLFGVAPSLSLSETATAAAKEVPGVKSAVSEIQIVEGRSIIH